MSAIVVRGLTKKFRKNLVLDQMDLEVYQGEIFSLLGLKDSGKTTFARLLFQFLKANSGSINIFDMDAVKESKTVKEFCSYVPEDTWLYENMKPISIFKKTLGFHDLKNMDDVHFLMDLFELDNKEKFVDLSDSKRKIVSIINALITKPKLLVIDEPNKYLPMGMVEKLFSHLRHLQETEGLTVLILSSSLALGQRYSDRAAYLSDGRIVDLEYIKDKDTNDKVLKIFDEIIPTAELESIGAKLLSKDQGESTFFFNGYLPTLTTVLYQQRVKNYTIEDAVLENKINSYFSKSKTSASDHLNPLNGDLNSFDPVNPSKEDTSNITTETVIISPMQESNTEPIRTEKLTEESFDQVHEENNNTEETQVFQPILLSEENDMLIDEELNEPINKKADDETTNISTSWLGDSGLNDREKV